MVKPNRATGTEGHVSHHDHTAVSKTPMAKGLAKGLTKGHLIYWFAIGFGAGLAPKMPGTVGTLVGIPIYLLIMDWWWWQYLAVVLLAFGFGVWICGEVSRRTGIEDAPFIVWDEIVGYLVTMIAAPSGWFWLVCGFLLFRGFDIWKPWPVKMIDQRVKGGFGIMLDDVVAGLYALLALQGLKFAIL